MTMDKTLDAIWTATHNGDDYIFARKYHDRWKETWNTLWLIDPQGITVGYICYIYDQSREHDNPYRFMLESIEVRDRFRGRGLAKFMIDAVQQHIGESMHCTGSFTPEGYAALAGYLPVADQTDNIVEFKSMSFVRDWDKALTMPGVR